MTSNGGDLMANEKSVRRHHDLKVWQVSIQLVKKIYGVTTAFPNEETYGLVSQMRRSAVSIPSNIAEGHARLSTREYIRHLSISLGSLAELETQVHLAQALGYTRNVIAGELLDKTNQLGKQIRNLTKSLKSRLQLGKK